MVPVPPPPGGAALTPNYVTWHRVVPTRPRRGTNRWQPTSRTKRAAGRADGPQVNGQRPRVGAQAKPARRRSTTACQPREPVEARRFQGLAQPDPWDHPNGPESRPSLAISASGKACPFDGGLLAWPDPPRQAVLQRAARSPSKGAPGPNAPV